MKVNKLPPAKPEEPELPEKSLTNVERAAHQKLQLDGSTSRTSPIQDETTAAAHGRQFFNTPRDMSYKTDGQNGPTALVGKESNHNGVPLLLADNGKQYRGTLTADGKSIASWQPVNEKGQPTGEPSIKILAERSGRPPSDMPAEKYVSASPKQTENQKGTTEFPQANSKTDGSKPYSTEERAHPLRSEDNPEIRQTIQPSVASDKEAKQTKLDQISISPMQPEMHRTSVPEATAKGVEGPQRTDAIAARTNSPEKLQNPPFDALSKANELRVSEKQERNSLSSFDKIEKPPTNDPRSEREHQTEKPLQGKIEPISSFEALKQLFKPLEPIHRADINQMFGESKTIGSPKIQDLIPFILGAARKPEPVVRDVLEPKIKTSRFETKLDPTLQAKIQRIEPAHKTKLLTVAEKVKGGLTPDKFAPADRPIAKILNSLDSKKLDNLIGWAKRGEPIRFDRFDDKNKSFQNKLGSLFETIMKAFKNEKDLKNAPPESAQKTNEKGRKDEARNGSGKATLELESKTTEKSHDRNSKVTGELKDATTPLQDTKTRFDAASSRTDESQTSKSDTRNTKVDGPVTQRTEDLEAITKRVSETVIAGTLYTTERPKPRRRSTKALTESTDHEAEEQPQNDSLSKSEQLKYSVPKGYKASYFNSGSGRLLQFGELGDPLYHIILEIFDRSWLRVIEASIKNGKGVYITHHLNRPASKYPMTVERKNPEMIQRNFVDERGERITEFLAGK